MRLALCVSSLSILERYVLARVKYDSLTSKMSYYLWGSEFSAHRLVLHIAVIVSVVGLFGYEARSTGDFRHLYFFGILGIGDLIGMLWKWRKIQHT
jgi:hypothetical protein